MFYRDLPTPSSPRLLISLLILLLGAGTVGCGKKGDPLPPKRTIPQPTRDLKITQQGEILSLRMGYPDTTTDGEVLPTLAEVELWQTVRPVADPELPPVVDAREFPATAERLLVLRGPELSSATEGSELVARLPLPGLSQDPIELHVFAVRTRAIEGEQSGFSNLVHLIPSTAPSPPSALDIESGAEGVRLSWQPPAEEVEGYSVYRRPAVAQGYAAPLAFVPAGTHRYLDESARFGERYIYTLTAVASRAPLRESTYSLEREIDYRDTYAPAPPADLVALPRVGGGDLVWKPSPDLDTAGYIVYRADPGGDFRRINPDLLSTPEWSDGGLASGQTFRYRVTAVDGLGNESRPSTEASLRTP